MSEETHYSRNLDEIPPDKNGKIKLTKTGNIAKYKEKASELLGNESMPRAAERLGKMGTMADLLIARGPRRKIKYTPELLWSSATEYFKWVEEHPIKTDKPHVLKNGEVIRVDIYKERPAMLPELCLWLGISLYEWEGYCIDSEFRPIMEDLYMYLQDQNFMGAVSGTMNASVMSKHLGLKDKHVVEKTETHQTPGAIAPVPKIEEIDTLTNKIDFDSLSEEEFSVVSEAMRVLNKKTSKLTGS